MKTNFIKSLPLAFLASASLVACSDEDFGYSKEQLAYAKQFREAFGEIDPAQDWNLATRASVTVSVSKPSQVRIYALNAGKYQIVGDYANVSGTQTLGVDVLEGVTDLLVSDGHNAFKTQIGGNVSFGSVTRTLYEGTYDPDEDVPANYDGDELVVTKGTDVDRKIYTREQVQAWNAVLPEIAISGESNGLQSMKDHKLCNINKVTRDFQMVSTGPFYLYPLFFLTNQTNTVGVYVKEGNDYKYAPLYTIKSGDELEKGNWGAWADFNGGATVEENKDGYDYRAHGYTDDTYQAAVWTEYTAPEGTANGYVGANFYKQVDGVFVWQDNAETLTDGTVFKTLTTPAQRREYVWTPVGGSLANADGSLPADVDKVRSRPVKIDIPVGTVFGFYIQLGGTATEPTPTFFSQSELNSDMDYILGFDSEGVVDPATTVLSSTKHACHVVNFELEGTTYLGFEDWTNVSKNSDMDFNDVMMVITGAKPTVVDEDPETASWVLACEDLGNTFDTDYNDVVFKVEHVSGRETATVTPLAAGGTLASHVFFDDQDLGEIHQMFGATPQNSGSYTPINVGSSRGNAGHQKTISVATDFSMASFQVGESEQGNANMGGFSVRVLPADEPAGSTNFGAASVVSAPSVGDVPEILCLPYTYSIENTPEAGKKTTYTWAWSQEMKTLAAAPGNTTYGAGSYPEFAGWVSDHNANTDWYMHPENSLTVAESSVVEDMTSGGGSGPYAGYTKMGETPSLSWDFNIVKNNDNSVTLSNSEQSITVSNGLVLSATNASNLGWFANGWSQGDGTHGTLLERTIDMATLRSAADGYEHILHVYDDGGSKAPFIVYMRDAPAQ